MAEDGRSFSIGLLVLMATVCRDELFLDNVSFVCFCFILTQDGRLSLQRLWIVTLHPGQLRASLAVMLLLQEEQRVWEETVMEVNR